MVVDLLTKMNFIRKSFSPICLIISLILLSYTFYKSEIHWNGTKNSFYLNYYIISFSLLFFSILSFFFSKKIKDYLIIIMKFIKKKLETHMIREVNLKFIMI